MGSLGFVGDEEYQSGSSNSKRCKLSKKLLDDCGAVNYASVPKKPRSAIRKRGRESITQYLPISIKPDQVSNGIVTLKNGAKKSKLNKRKGRITKDEREVAETLNALADLFSDATKSNKTALNGDAQQPVLAFEKQLDAPGAFGIQLDLSPSSRSKVSTFDITPRGERPVTLEKVTASGFVCGMHYYPNEGRSSGFYQSTSLAPSIELRSKTQGFSPKSSNNKLPSWLEIARRSTQPSVIENSVTADMYPQVVVEKNTWKKCSAHIYISRLIKVLQLSDNKEELLEKPTPCRGVQNWHCVSSTNDQKTGINGRDDFLSLNGATHSNVEENTNEIHNAILLHKRLIQDQQQQLPSNNSILCSTKQVLLPPYLPLGQHLESQQQKWTSQLLAQYNHGVAASQDYTNQGRELLNYNEALVSHLHSSKYQQQFSPSQQPQQFMAMSTPSSPFSNHVKRQNHHYQIHHHPLNFQQEKWFFATPTNL